MILIQGRKKQCRTLHELMRARVDGQRGSSEDGNRGAQDDD